MTIRSSWWITALLGTLCNGWAMQGTIEVSGTVFAPAGKTVEGTYVIFCPVINNATDCDTAETEAMQISANQKTASAAYKFTIKAGKWVVYADKDVDGNGKILSNGDYSGCYGESGNVCWIVEASKSGVDIRMRVVGR